MKKLHLMFAPLFAAGCATTLPPPGAQMSATERTNVELHRKAYALFSAHDASMFELFDENIVEMQEPKDLVGRVALIEFNHSLWGGFSDIRVEVERAWGAGTHTFVAGRLLGTNDGTFAPMGLDKTGKKIDVAFVEMVEWKNGKAVHSYPVMDEVELGRQLGATP